MTISADWWASIDEQMKQFKVNRLAVLKQKGANQIHRLSLKKGSKNSKASGSKLDVSESAKVADSQPLQPYIGNEQPAQTNYIDDIPTLQSPPIMVNDFAAFPQLQPAPTEEERRMANMTVTERMEYQLQKKVSGSSAPNVSNFDSPIPTFSFNSPSNAWDSLGGGNEGGW